MSNILNAFKNIITISQTEINNNVSSHNRANQMGESLEVYVKDLFCNSFSLSNNEKIIEYNKHFSYLGNQNNPPDIILRNGDAIEVKKIEYANSSLALNSSHPKDKLYIDDPKINNSCRTAEKWSEKDIIYTVGYVNNSRLKYIWFVYGDCYSANRDVYKRVSDSISNGVNTISGIEFESTNELARVNKVDPLGITYLRVRGMWGISNPVKVFNYLSQTNNKFANLLLLTKKYNSFSKDDRQEIESLINDNFTINDVKINDPNNPANLLEAKLLSYSPI